MRGLRRPRKLSDTHKRFVASQRINGQPKKIVSLRVSSNGQVSLSFLTSFPYLRWHTDGNTARRHRFRNNGVCADHCSIAYLNVTKQNATGSKHHVVANPWDTLLEYPPPAMLSRS